MESRISTKEHQLLLDAIKEHAIFMIDTGGHIISWNEGAKRLKGFDENEVMGKHFRMLFVPEDQLNHRPEWEMQQALDTGKFEEEWWRLRKGGSWFWAHIILQPVFDEQQQHIGFAKITTDRSKQKSADELTSFLMNEVSGYAIFLLDGAGKVAKWSNAAASITGHTEQEIMGTSLSVFYLHQEGDEPEALAQQHLSAAMHNRYEDEDWKVRKDGSYFWASYIVSPLHNKDGYVVMIRDLTTKKAMDQAANAQIALAASNQDLERFAHIIGHDLKEPIRKVVTFCDKLRAEAPLQQDLINKIVSASLRAKNLIDDILDFSALAQTRVFIKQDLNLILDFVIDSLSELIGERQAVVQRSPLPVVRVIPSQMEQLFQNLVTNAIKFCCAEDQTPLIHIDGVVVPRTNLHPAVLNQVVHAEQYLQIRVQDNGIGFEQHYATSIFELLIRLHGKAEYEGTGVGLAICKKVAESHGGYISATSEKGKGSLFVVTLPFHAD